MAGVDYLVLSLIMLLGQFSPGPDMLLLLRNSLAHPRRAGIFTVLGIAAGLCVHCTLALTGLGVAIRNSATAHALLLTLGGLWLGWLGVKLLLSLRVGAGAEAAAAAAEATADGRRTRAPLGDRAAFLQGLLTNLMNAKAVIFLASVLVSWMGPEPTLARKTGFFLIITGQALLFWSLFVMVLQHPRVERMYHRIERRLNAAFGVALLLLAARALAEGMTPLL